MQAAALVAAPLAYLMTNDFERGQRREARRGRLLLRDHPERDPASAPGSSARAPCGPGATVPAEGRCCARTAARRVSQTIPVAIPANAPAGTYSLLVADGAALDRARAARDAAAVRAQGPRPADPRHQRRCAATTTSTRACCAPTRARSCAASTCSRCPRRCSRSWAGRTQGGDVVPIRTAAVWDFDLPTDYAVTGSGVLTLTVER